MNALRGGERSAWGITCVTCMNSGRISLPLARRAVPDLPSWIRAYVKVGQSHSLIAR